MMKILRWIVILILFSFLSTAAVIFTPAFPELSKQFQLSSADAQWMMTIFFLGTAFGRLPYGPLANRYGRKKTLLLGLFIAILGTLLILSTESYAVLCLGRLIQALGCTVTLKIGYTMVGDLYSGAEATRVLSYSLFAYAILPGIGTSVSGLLVASYGWRGGFWFFLLFTVCFMLLCLTLPETMKKADPDALKIKRIASAYAKQFRNLSLVLWGSLMGLSTAVLFIFSQEAPFIAIDIMGMTPVEYGFYFLVPAIGIAAGSLATAWLADKWTPLKGMKWGIFTILFSTLGRGALLLCGFQGWWVLFIPQTLIQFGDALLYTNASSAAMTEAEDKSNASAILLFINSFVSVLGTFFVGILAPRESLAMPISFLIIVAIMWALWILLRRHGRRKCHLDVQA
jgi:MFS family permease